ncbi:MAG: FISUMP domain-containing protein [Bacteroidales bacterium]|nr:FISUMP domain-containing protein [Bacteroidales bacterium]
MGNFSTWIPNTVPALINTGNPNQKMLSAQQAGVPGFYPIEIALSDNAGSSSVTTLLIHVSTVIPQIIAGDINYNFSYGTPFLEEIIINSENELSSGNIKIATNNYNLLNQTITLSINNCVGLPPTNGGLEACLEKLSDQEYSIKIKENSNGISSSVFAPGNYPYTVLVDSVYGSNSKDFSINISADTPVLNLNNCLTVANLGDYYECNLSVYGSNEGVSFSVGSNLPQGLSYDSANKKIKGYLLKMVIDYPITVSAQNNLGMSSSKTFSLNITSNCGNYLVQYPGGPWNSNGTIRNQGGYYKTVLIGNQCWLKDNLNIGNMILSTDESANNTTFEKFCQDNDLINCNLFGGLYKWDEAIDYFYNDSLQGICPEGWRVPIDNEWYVLENYLKNDGQACIANREGSMSCLDAGDKLKTTILNSTPPWTGSNSSGFSALFNPRMESDGSFFVPDSLAPSTWQTYQWTSYWSATQNTSDTNKAIARLLNSNSNGVQRESKLKTEAHSIRCIREVNQCNIDSDCNYLGGGYLCNDGFCISSLGVDIGLEIFNPFFPFIPSLPGIETPMTPANPLIPSIESPLVPANPASPAIGSNLILANPSNSNKTSANNPSQNITH